MADAELSLKTTFAGQVGLSVANIRLHEALRTQSIKDSLTGLYNRRYLEEMMERETRRAVRAEQGLGVMMLDLDHFKKFNHTYGHDAGDAVFRETASFLLKSVRAEDIVCRFGGEEFVVILTGRRPENNSGPRGTNPPQTARVVGDTPRPVSRNDHRVCRRRRTSAAWYFPKELLEAADAALYRAKREGRDRVMVAASRPVAESVLPTEVKLP